MQRVILHLAMKPLPDLYGFHCADLLNKGTTTACLQVDSQTGSGLAINIANNTQVTGAGLLTKYNGMTAVAQGISPIIAVLDQTGVSTANSGTPQNVLRQLPVRDITESSTTSRRVQGVQRWAVQR